jgi:hypothetical protein
MGSLTVAARAKARSKQEVGGALLLAKNAYVARSENRVIFGVSFARFVSSWR